jgi:hypothetical protein
MVQVQHLQRSFEVEVGPEQSTHFRGMGFDVFIQPSLQVGLEQFTHCRGWDSTRLVSVLGWQDLKDPPTPVGGISNCNSTLFLDTLVKTIHDTEVLPHDF